MSDPSYPDALPAQHRLHWYVLERVLGQGGFGITYLARDTNLDQAVAIKEYLPVDVATRRPDASVRSRTEEQSERYRWGLDRFIREARTLARFDHPNVVRVHSVFEFNNTAYMVMRFEEGENLAALLERRRTLPEDELVRVLLPILEGLELVHNAGFIHRDIKPDNIYIRVDGSPVLLDFGSARSSMGHARTVTILVAPGYAPFEQYYSSGENQGPWTDLYSLAATCYRAISGIAPMDAIARSKGILGSTHEILVPAATIGSGRYSAGLLKAIDHALQFAEKDRPQSIAEWRRELLSDGKPARPAAAPPAAAVRGPVIWASLGALVAAVAVVLWLVPSKEKPEPTPPPPAGDVEEVRRAQRQVQEELQAKIAELEQKMNRDAEERRKAELKAKAEAEAKRDSLRKQADAESARKRDEAKKRDEERKRDAADSAPVAPPKEVAKPAPPPPPPDPIQLAEAARARGDEAASLALYRKAADQGNAEAQFRLGELYAAGRGVTQSNYLAYVWFSMAALAGHADATVRRDQVAGNLQPAEVEQANRLVRDRRRAMEPRKG